MNVKQAALDRVSLQAHEYFDLQIQTERQRQRLVNAIKDAAALDNTQQKIADQTVTAFPLVVVDGGPLVKKISRQRVAQIIQEKPDA